MTTSFPELADPRETFLEAGYQPVVIGPKKKDSPHLLLIGMGIGAAILGIKMVMSHQLAKKNPQSPEEARGFAMKIWEANRSVWRKLATPSVVDAYALGGPTLFIPGDALEKLAVIYVDELGDYFNQTSVDALVEGFSAQLNSGWSNDISWRRSTPAYGLDSKQTRSYVITLTEQAKGKYDPQPIPEKSAAAIDKLMLDRADRIGSNEAYKATQMGRNTVWLYMEKHGDIHGAKKRWITANDELVCSVCASLDRQEKELGDPFETPTGEKIHAPGAHPNCRCEIVLNMGMNIIKNMAGDPFDRDHHGRFARREERNANPVGMGTRLPPIGSYYAPIGSSGSPIGSMTGPIGWARGPIGTTLPPIGTRAAVANELPPIGLAPAEVKPKNERQRPKISQGKTKIKNPLPSKTKATTKTQVTSTVSNQSSIASSIPLAASVSIENKSDIEYDTDLRIHRVKAVFPGRSVMNSENYADLLRFRDQDMYVYFDGNMVGFAEHEGMGLDTSNANNLAFDQEMAYLTPDKGEKARPSGSVDVTSELGGETVVIFQMLKGWYGQDLVEQEGDPPQAIPVGWYKVSGRPDIQDPAAERKANRSAFPESVARSINQGGPFSYASSNAPLVTSVMYVNLERVAYTPKKSDGIILKRAPRLILRRK